MLGKGVVIAEIDEFCFFTGKPDSSPNSGWKGYTMVRWRQRVDNPFQPDYGIPAYLNGYAVIPLVAGMIEKGMEPGTVMHSW